MIEETAIVVKTKGHTVWLESAASSGCGQCQSKAGCGQTAFSQLFGLKKPQFKAESKGLLNEGDHVLVGIDERALVRGSMLVYLLPLILMIFFAVIAAGVSSLLGITHEGITIVGGLIGLYAGFRYASLKALIFTKIKAFQPIILKQL